MPLEQVFGSVKSKRVGSVIELSVQALIREKRNLFKYFEEYRKIQRAIDVELDFGLIKKR